MIEVVSELNSVCDGLTENLNRLLNVEHKNIVISGQPAKYVTSLVLSYINDVRDKYKYVFYACYDKEKYLFYDKNSYVSVDCILKKSIIRPLIGRYKNSFEFFESCLNEQSLVVIDNYSIPSISPYLRHIAKSGCKLIVVCDKTINKLPDDFFLFNPVFNSVGDDVFQSVKMLDGKEKELLVTLCAMLRYLDVTTKIESSKSGVFDKSSVRFYLGDLSCKLDSLLNAGLVKADLSGRITVDKTVSDYVFDNFNPCAESCPAFMNFVEESCGFDIVMEEKDVYARLCASEDEDVSFSESEEFLDVYTHFALSDKNAVKHIYNALMSRTLVRLGSEIGNTYVNHLKMRNACFYIRFLYEKLRGKTAEIMYEHCSDEVLLDTEILARLDVIRICVCFLRNLTLDLYGDFREILEVLYNSMNDLFVFASKIENDSLRAEILDDCIRICSETFMYFQCVDDEGDFYNLRAFYKNARLGYSMEKYSDNLYGQSLVFGFSTLTVLLYGMFQKYLDEWLEIHEKSDFDIVSENIQLRKRLFEDISVEYVRIKNGFDSFYDFCNQSNKSIRVSEDCIKTDLDERLNKNIHLLERGFDNGTKTGAEKYSSQIMSEIRKCKMPYYLVKILLNPQFPISDYCCKLLLEKGFVKFVSTSKCISNRDRQKLLLYLVDTYSEQKTDMYRKKLSKELIGVLYAEITPAGTFIKKLNCVAASMYLENKTWSGNSEKDFSDTMYEKFCIEADFRTETCDEYIAKAMYRHLNGLKQKINKVKMSNAFRAVVYDYLTVDNSFNVAGLLEWCRIFCGNGFASELDEIIKKYEK